MRTWRIKVLRLFSTSTKAVKNEGLAVPPSVKYSDDSDGCDSDTETKTKRKPWSTKSTSSDITETASISNTMSSRDLIECDECGRMRSFNWCRRCESKVFIKNFPNWTSKNEELDKFIRNTQCKAYDHRYYWEWIPFEKFSNIQYLSNGNVFTAIWLEGPRNQWDTDTASFVRRKWCKVVLKRLVYSPNNIEPEFIRKLRDHYGHKRSRCNRTVQIYGMTQDPETDSYMLVTAYHNKRDIRTLLQEGHSELTWSDKLRMLHNCAEALLAIHLKGFTHKNLHAGNLLSHSRGTNIYLNISDLGLYNQPQGFGEIVGVIPYVAPEVLNGWPFTQDSDIYSFAMLMFEFATGLNPFHDRAHDEYLIFDICERGLRPQYNSDDIPEFYVELMHRCWDAEPVKRPNANEILFTIKDWDAQDFPDKFERDDFAIHPEAIYTSRPLTDIISRVFELQFPLRDEKKLSEQDEQMEEFSEESSEEEEEEEKVSEQVTYENEDEKTTNLELEFEHDDNSNHELKIAGETSSDTESEMGNQSDTTTTSNNSTESNNKDPF